MYYIILPTQLHGHILRYTRTPRQCKSFTREWARVPGVCVCRALFIENARVPAIPWKPRRRVIITYTHQPHSKVWQNVKGDLKFRKTISFTLRRRSSHACVRETSPRSFISNLIYSLSSYCTHARTRNLGFRLKCFSLTRFQSLSFSQSLSDVPNSRV